VRVVMIKKQSLVKVGLASLVVAVVAIEIALLFLPDRGAIPFTIDFIKTTRATEKAGMSPCIVCGAPAVPITYDKMDGKTIVGHYTVSEYCETHAPNLVLHSDTVPLLAHTKLRLLLGYTLALCFLIGTLSGLLLLKEQTDILFIRQKIYKRLKWSFGGYVLVNVFFLFSS